MWGARKKSGWGASWTTSELSASTPISDDCNPGREGMAQNGRTRGGTFHGELIAADEARAGLRHEVVCPNVTGRAKERIAQSKRARGGSLDLVD